MRNNTSTFQLLKFIIKSKTVLSTEKIISEFYKSKNLISANSDLDELMTLGYITIYPSCGIVGPTKNIRPFFNNLKNFDFLSNLDSANVVKPTLRGVDYYNNNQFEYLKFLVPLSISLLSLIVSVLAIWLSIIKALG